MIYTGSNPITDLVIEGEIILALVIVIVYLLIKNKNKMLTKEEKKNKEKQIRNRKYKTLIKNRLKKVDDFLKANETDIEKLKKLVSEAQKVLDKSSNKKVIHKNKASNKKSQLYKKLNELRKPAEVG